MNVVHAQREGGGKYSEVRMGRGRNFLGNSAGGRIGGWKAREEDVRGGQCGSWIDRGGSGRKFWKLDRLSGEVVIAKVGCKRRRNWTREG